MSDGQPGAVHTSGEPVHNGVKETVYGTIAEVLSAAQCEYGRGDWVMVPYDDLDNLVNQQTDDGVSRVFKRYGNEWRNCSLREVVTAVIGGA